MDKSLSIANFARKYPDLLSVKDIQEILNIGRSTAYKLLKSGEISSIQIGSIYRIPKAYLLKYIRQYA